MLGKVHSCGLTGIRGRIVVIEADASNGLPSYDTVGLPDKAVTESRERIRIALRNCGLDLPPKRITVNLAPADFRKIGTVYDLPIALALLQATERLPLSAMEDCMAIGELSLNGDLRKIDGILPMAIAAKENGFKRLICPKDNASEASFVDGMEIIPAENLKTLYDMLLGERPLLFQEKKEWNFQRKEVTQDFSLIRGQFLARRAAEIAAAGGHNMLLNGPPGAGKTMIARALPGILPDLSFEEALEISCIYSAAGKLEVDGLVEERPFRAPHHNASLSALVGGGSFAKPGEISLAHLGVLFLDEMPEFSRSALESLRQPIEDGHTTISRVRSSERFPARFMLVAAMNPCPCGYYGSRKQVCTCTQRQIERYRSKLSGPLLDRIDLFIAVEELEYKDFYAQNTAKPEGSDIIRKRVNDCRAKQLERFSGTNIYANAQMSQGDIEKYCIMNQEAQKLLKSAFIEKNMSGRAHARILRLARTIADMDMADEIGELHLAEALQYRSAEALWN